MSSEEIDELKAAYAELDHVIRKISVLEGLRDGLVTDWVTIAAVQAYDDEGSMLSTTMRLLPDSGKFVAPYRIEGLLNRAIKEFDLEMNANIVSSYMDDEED